MTGPWFSARGYAEYIAELDDPPTEQPDNGDTLPDEADDPVEGEQQ